jgi:hypothetical protein
VLGNPFEEDALARAKTLTRCGIPEGHCPRRDYKPAADICGRKTGIPRRRPRRKEYPPRLLPQSLLKAAGAGR